MIETIAADLLAARENHHGWLMVHASPPLSAAASCDPSVTDGAAYGYGRAIVVDPAADPGRWQTAKSAGVACRSCDQLIPGICVHCNAVLPREGPCADCHLSRYGHRPADPECHSAHNHVCGFAGCPAGARVTGNLSPGAFGGVSASITLTCEDAHTWTEPT